MPPLTTPTPLRAPTSGSVADDVFASAVTGSLSGGTRSNALLDSKTIAALATGIVASKPAVSTISAAARPTHFRVQYAVDGNEKHGRIVVEIDHHTEPAAAQQLLRQHLATFDYNVAQKTDKPLGQVSLHTGASVFWVRDAIWVRVHSVATVKPKPATTARTEPQQLTPANVRRTAPNHPGTTPSSGAGEGTSASTRSINTAVLVQVLLPLATALDAHIAKGAVPASSQLRPNTQVKSSSYKGPRGKEFSFQLVDASNTHGIKPVEPVQEQGGGARSIVVPLGNGSPDGTYSLVGRRSGKGRLLLVVTRADTLAVGAAEVSVEITES